MACGLVDMEQDTCPAVAGGIMEARVIPCEDIEEVTIAENGQVTALTLSDAGAFVKLKFDKDDTGFYNQEGERPTRNIHISNQSAFMKFSGLDSTKVDAARKLKRCCCVVAVYRLGNGKYVIQGIEPIPGSTSGEWQFSKQETKATVSIFSGTGAEEDRIEVTLSGQAFEESLFTTLDFDDLDAL